MDAALRLRDARARRPLRRRAGLRAGPVVDAAPGLSRLRRAVDRRAGAGHVGRAALLVGAPGRRHRRLDRRPARASRGGARARGGRTHRRDRAARTRAAGRRDPHRGRAARAHRDRARDRADRRIQARAARAPEAAVRRPAGQQAAAGGPARRGADAHRADGHARVAGDDQPHDREEAGRLRRRGARGRRRAGPGHHALRDRAGHRRQGLADRQPRQGPGALAEPGQHPRGGDDPRQDDDGAGAAQRAPPDDQAVRDPRLQRLQRGRLDADHRARQGHRRQPDRGRPREDAALPGGRHHRFGQVGGHQRDDPVAAVQGRRQGRPPDPDRSEDARDERL